jgi:hypothetical protein
MTITVNETKLAEIKQAQYRQRVEDCVDLPETLAD